MRLASTVTLALLLAPAALAQSGDWAEADRLFALGGELFAEGDHRGAAAAYEGALATGWASPALYLNLGSAHFEAGRVGRARLAFERAARLAPADADVRRGLRMARLAAGDRRQRAPTLTEAAVRSGSVRVGGGVLTALAFLLWAGLLGLAGRAAWQRRRLTPQQLVLLRRVAAGLVPVTVAALAFAVAVTRYEARPRAVVVAPGAVLREAPTPEAAEAATLPEGHDAALLDRRGGWVALRRADGTTGWADAATVEEI